ncbi:MAG: PAS domain S-box protein [Acidobacteriota bacterium]
MSNQLMIRILLVEDNFTDVLLLRETLSGVANVEFALTHVVKLSEALSRIQNEVFDVVLLDLGLPDSSGVDTIMQFHQQAPAIPVLVLTGVDNEDTGIAALQEGAQDYLVKNQLQPALLGRAIRYAIERHRAATALQESELRLAAIVDSPMDAIVIVDDEHHITLFNSAAEQLFGYRETEVIGKSINLLIPERFREAHIEHIRAFGESSNYPIRMDQRREVVGLRADGTEFPIETSIAQFIVTGRKMFTAIVRDITNRKKAQAEILMLNQNLQRRIDEMETLLNVLPIPIGIASDPECRHIRANPAFAELLAISPDANASLSADEAERPKHFKIYQRDRELAPEELPLQIAASQGREIRDFEAKVIRSDGTSVDILGYTSPLFDEHGKARGSVGAFVDITERKRAELLNEGQKQVLEMIASGAPLKATLEALLRFVEASSAGMLCSILLLDAEGKHLYHGAAPSLPQEYTTAIDGIAIGPQVGSCGTAAFQRQAVFVRDIATDPLWKNYKDLALGFGLHACWSTPIFDDQQRLLGTFAMYYHQPALPSASQLQLIEIATHTAAICINKHRTEEAMAKSHEQLRLLIEQAPISIAMFDRDMRYLTTSRRWIEDYGRGYDDLTGRSHYEVNPDLPDEWKAIHQRGLAGEMLRNDDDQWLHSDGTRQWLRWAVLPWRNSRDEIGGIIISAEDITERKRAQLRLATQESISRTLVEAKSLAEAMPRVLKALCESENWDFSAMWRVDKQADWLDCLEVWHQPDFRAPELLELSRKCTFKSGEGLPGIIWQTGKSLYWENLKNAHFYLRSAPAMDAGYYSAFGFPILLGDEVTGVIDCLGHQLPKPDQSLLDMLEVIGKQIGQFIEHRRAEEAIQRFVAYSPTVLYALKIKGDKLVYGWTSDNIFDLTGYTVKETLEPDWWVNHIHPEDKASVLSAQPVPYDLDHQIQEFRFRRKDGSYFWVRDEKRLLRDEQGMPAEIIGCWSDISDRIELEDQLRQSQKMEAVGRLAGGIAHDFNNLLTVIIGYSDLLYSRFSESDINRSLADNIRNAGQRAAVLTRQLLAFSRKQVLEPKVLDLNEIVTNTEKLLKRLIGEDINLKTELSPALSPIKVDPGQIEQVIINLAVNSRDALPQGGQLTIATKNIKIDEKNHHLYPSMPHGNYVQLVLSDNGCGMPPEIKARIFEPFFTTKEVGKGTGLGLATVFGIVKQSEGFIEVDSEIDKGTTFAIYLPAFESPDSGKSTDGELKPSGTGSETILLVEDEESVRQIAKLTLEMRGYLVLEARNARDAIFLRENYSGKIDLLVTDVVMPEMSGRELAERLRMNDPTLNILFMSGYIDDAILRHGISAAHHTFLSKPFSPSALVEKVRHILDEPKKPS